MRTHLVENFILNKNIEALFQIFNSLEAKGPAQWTHFLTIIFRTTIVVICNLRVKQ